MTTNSTHTARDDRKSEPAAPNAQRTIMIPTPDGTFAATFSTRGLKALDFPNGRTHGEPPPPNLDSPWDHEPWSAEQRCRPALILGQRRSTARSELIHGKEKPGENDTWPGVDPSWVRKTRQALLQILNGKEARSFPPLDLTGATDFQQRVWRMLQAIPVGRTRSYGDIAAELHCPGGARAVGQACGANPIPVLVPCHRVISASGKLGGFSGGLDWKMKLLQREKSQSGS